MADHSDPDTPDQDSGESPDKRTGSSKLSKTLDLPIDDVRERILAAEAVP
ncbi:hypothetical protein [Thiocystis violacea]|nr:hypothetical protein [Thiocystis violacea]